MSRPTTKEEMLALSEKNLQSLLSFIDSLPNDYKNRIYSNDELNDRDKTISDIICHLHEWHQMMIKWYEMGMTGEKPAIPAEGITWQTLPVLNRRIYEQYKGTELSKGIEMLKKSYSEVVNIIKNHSNDELFTKKKYNWTGSTSLGAYLISATSSHYDWALKTIKPIKKLIK